MAIDYGWRAAASRDALNENFAHALIALQKVNIQALHDHFSRISVPQVYIRRGKQKSPSTQRTSP